MSDSVLDKLEDNLIYYKKGTIMKNKTSIEALHVLLTKDKTPHDYRTEAFQYLLSTGNTILGELVINTKEHFILVGQTDRDDSLMMSVDGAIFTDCRVEDAHTKIATTLNPVKVEAEEPPVEDAVADKQEEKVDE